MRAPTRPVPAILVSCDDANLRRTLALMLERAGYAVTVDEGPQEGRVYPAAGALDLILIDIVESAQEGYEKLSHLRVCCPGVPVLVLAAQTLSGLEADLQQRGASAVVFKPVDPEHLLAQVAALLKDEGVLKSRAAPKV